MKYIKSSHSIFVVISTVCILCACGPSQAEIDETVTHVAVPKFASQTTGAPTTTLNPTNTPLPTATPTMTPSPTSTPTPSLGIGSTQNSPIDGMTMIYVPEGVFEMGSTENDSQGNNDEIPKHSVFLDAYWIDETEVTNAMFAAFVDSTGYETDAELKGTSYLYLDGDFQEVDGVNWQNPQGSGSNLDDIKNHPIVHVSWNDANAYCQWAGRRLPTEAEWEKSARGDGGLIYPWGDHFSCSKGNFDDETVLDDNVVSGVAGCDGYDRTAPVGSFPEGTSLYGALDMAGNVYEWVADWYGSEYYNNSPTENPLGPETGKHRVLRGGSFSEESDNVRSAYRERIPQDLAVDDLGFRCALSVKPLAPTPTPQPSPTPLAIEGLLTFSSDRDGPLGIYIMNANGTGSAELVTIHPYHETMPSWSPSGDQIAFVSARDLDPDSPIDPIDIYVMNSDGRGVTRLTNNPQNFQPAWSPDNQRIVFHSNRDGDNNIYVMNADGGGVKKLTDHPGFDGNPAWSPDGNQIAFNSDRDGDLEIFLMNVDGSNIIQLTDNTATDADPVWSPDEGKIAFESDRDGNFDIYVMNADGSEATKLTDHPESDGYPAWSPDGNHIAFVSGRDGNAEIYVMNSDGSGITRLTDNPASDEHPSWSPPGAMISTDPWFGTPWCSRDTDGDMHPDTATIKFKGDDLFAYIMFPFRNMKDGLNWSHNWISESGFVMDMVGWWDGGESGLHTAMLSAPSFGRGKLTIQLTIEGEVVQEIECEVVEP